MNFLKTLLPVIMLTGVFASSSDAVIIEFKTNDFTREFLRHTDMTHGQWLTLQQAGANKTEIDNAFRQNFIDSHSVKTASIRITSETNEILNFDIKFKNGSETEIDIPADFDIKSFEAIIDGRTYPASKKASLCASTTTIKDLGQLDRIIVEHIYFPDPFNGLPCGPQCRIEYK